MSAGAFIAFALGLALFLGILNLLMSRGKFEAKGFLLVVGYGFAVGLPVAYATMFRDEVNLAVYGLVSLPIALPFIANEFVSLIKGRGPRFRSACAILGMASMILVPFFPYGISLAPILFGLACMGIFLAFHCRYPGLNPMWLADLVARAVKGVPLGCGYSPKPITILLPSRIHFRSGIFGCSVYVRKDKTIVWMTKKFHESLGKPNMEILCQRIAEMVHEEGGKK